MDFAVREEEQTVAELARKILTDFSTNERLKELEAVDAPTDEPLWEALAESSLLATAIPEEYGGMDLGFSALCLLLQEVGRAVARVPVFPSMVLGALPLARFGNSEQREWLREIATGDRIVTAALTEYASSDPMCPTTTATKKGSDYAISGVKSKVPCAEQAAQILVPVRCDDGEIAVFYVEPGADGVSLRGQKVSDGQAYAEVELTDVVVGEGARLGAPAEGRGVLQWLVDRATAARCMMQLGVVERALEMTAEYSRERIQFERPIGSFQAVHQRAADAYINVEAVRLSAQEAVWRLSEELPAAEHVAVAKYWAAEGGQYAAFACQHLHGGIGIDVDYPLHRHYIWAIAIEHEFGSAPQQLERLGRDLALNGPPAL